MTPSQRIAVIREISRLLGQEDWSLLDLTLRQFGFPTTDQWEGPDRPAYVIHMIDTATDEQLLGLAEHLGISADRDVVRTAELPFWEPDEFRLFVTHVSTVRELADQIKVCLRPYHISAFVAHNDIEPTQDWLEQIEGALFTADALLAILTGDFHPSLWTDQEIGVALGRSIVVIPLRLGIDPYGLFGKYQGLSGHGKTPVFIAQEIVQTLAGNKRTNKRMAYSLVAALRHSGSFELARRNMDLIEATGFMDAVLAKRMRDAVENNSQVSEAWGVPQRIESLIMRWNPGT